MLRDEILNTEKGDALPCLQNGKIGEQVFILLYIKNVSFDETKSGNSGARDFVPRVLGL